MDRLDLMSIVVAGAIGAILLTATDHIRGVTSTTTSTIAYGFGIGAAVQISVRLMGVS